MICGKMYKVSLKTPSNILSFVDLCKKRRKEGYRKYVMGGLSHVTRASPFFKHIDILTWVSQKKSGITRWAVSISSVSPQDLKPWRGWRFPSN